MRLLNTSTYTLREFRDDEIPDHVILSHVWGEQEVTLKDMGPHAKDKKGYAKIQGCCSVAAANNYEYAWIDSCCIDKTSSAELSEAINSMYHWYEEASVCYAFLGDVTTKAEVATSKWFTRGWTLQELIAPPSLIFFNKNWEALGTKDELAEAVSNRTGIPLSILSGEEDLMSQSVAQRMSWASQRNTTRIEDGAYSLLGIFGINMPLIYGERGNAFIRLQEEIMRVTDDETIFAWQSQDRRGGLLATSPHAFLNGKNIIRFDKLGPIDEPPSINSQGIHLKVHFLGLGRCGIGVAILRCCDATDRTKPVGIYVRDLDFSMKRFERFESHRIVTIELKAYARSRFSVCRVCVQRGNLLRRKKLEVDLHSQEGEINLKATEAALGHFWGPKGLIEAAKKGNTDSVWLLLTLSDIEEQFNAGKLNRAFWVATENGHASVLNILLQRCQFPINDIEENKEGESLLVAAVRGNIPLAVELLINAGIHLEPAIHPRQSALSYAAMTGQADMVRLLAERGADIASLDPAYKTPLTHAAENGHTSVVEALVQLGADSKYPRFAMQDKFSRTPLSYAAEKGYTEIVRMLVHIVQGLEANYEGLGIPIQRDRTPLSFAAEKGHDLIVQYLLNSGGNPLIGDAACRSPLHFAVNDGHEDIVKLLLKKSAACLQTRDLGGKTPFYYAVKRGATSLAQLLLDMGDTVQTQDKARRSPLYYALEDKNQDMADLLIANGAILSNEPREVRKIYKEISKQQHKASNERNSLGRLFNS